MCDSRVFSECATVSFRVSNLHFLAADGHRFRLQTASTCIRLLRGGALGPSDCESCLDVLGGNDLQVVGAGLCKSETLACSVLGDHSEGTLVDCYPGLV